MNVRRARTRHPGSAQVRREDRDALVLLHLLQQVRDLDVGVPVVRVLDLGPLAEQRVRLVEEQNRVARPRLGNIRSRFFSVSPMYLLTTCDRSIL